MADITSNEGIESPFAYFVIATADTPSSLASCFFCKPNSRINISNLLENSLLIDISVI